MPVRPNHYVENLNTYKITPQEPWIEEDRRSILKLDWNEGSYIPDFVSVLATNLIKSGEYYNWYPDYSSVELHQQLSLWLDISVMQILSFPGSDVALDAICRCYLEPNSIAAITTPSYDNFNIFARSTGASVVHIPIPKPFDFDAEFVIGQALLKKAKLLYLVSPNNPCGYIIEPSDISKICRTLPDVLIVCDHAYVEFSPYADCTHLIAEHENLVITRTFSKAFSLAGMRMGYVVAQHHILEVLAKFRNGKNLNMFSQKIVIECLKNIEFLNTWINQVTSAREMLYKGLSKMGIHYYESHANFVLFEPRNPETIVAELKRRKIYVRDKRMATGGGIRVTVTHKAAMSQFLSALEKIVLGKIDGLHLTRQSLL